MVEKEEGGRQRPVDPAVTDEAGQVLERAQEQRDGARVEDEREQPDPDRGLL